MGVGVGETGAFVLDGVALSAGGNPGPSLRDLLLVV